MLKGGKEHERSIGESEKNRGATRKTYYKFLLGQMKWLFQQQQQSTNSIMKETIECTN